MGTLSLNVTSMKIFFICLSFFLLADILYARHLLVKREANPEPQSRGRAQNRLFGLNQAGTAGLAGAAIGAGTQTLVNNLFNPCRNRRKNTNNRIFTGNPTIDNGALGFIAGFAGSALFNNAFGGGCG